MQPWWSWSIGHAFHVSSDLYRVLLGGGNCGNCGNIPMMTSWWARSRAFLHSVICVKFRHLLACLVQAVQLLPIFSEALRKYPLGQLSTPAELLSSMWQKFNDCTDPMTLKKSGQVRKFSQCERKEYPNPTFPDVQRKYDVECLYGWQSSIAGAPHRTCWDSEPFHCHRQCTRPLIDRRSNVPQKTDMLRFGKWRTKNGGMFQIMCCSKHNKSKDSSNISITDYSEYIRESTSKFMCP